MTTEALDAQLVAVWRDAPFPPGSNNDQLDELHADLALIDTWVAESLLPYLHSRTWEPAVPDVFGALDQLERSLGQLELGPEDRQQSGRYLEYALLLRGAYDAFLRMGDRDERHPDTLSGCQ
ncbi:hypothetical protein [Agromyces humatus]|uniref:DUF4254 domain-containing protein n=1 Tax=Agromyces humatus TaxID=279573 RepID=A0ABN2KD80_9MICO|nr:hypothetical protein [Agromyces humatus]